ncbi:MAG: 3-keto-disaccharide hydrolase [Cecembia sp.]
MKKLLALLVLFTTSLGINAQDGWIPLFNGKDLDGWKISENPNSFAVEDGLIKVDGPRAHAFYVGEVNGAVFEDFELMVELKTMPKANSGIFFHTAYQETGWPDKGYEVQVNQTHSDWRKSGSLYSFNDVRETYVEDGEWYITHIIVKGDHVTVKLNGQTVMEYIESKDEKRPENAGAKKIDKGTFAIQAHDPESVIYYRSIKVKVP